MTKSKRRATKKNSRKDAEKRGEADAETAVPNTVDWQTLKVKKANAKGHFTRVKNQLFVALDKPEVSEEDLFELKEKVRHNFDKLIECLVQLLDAASKDEKLRNHCRGTQIILSSILKSPEIGGILPNIFRKT